MADPAKIPAPDNRDSEGIDSTSTGGKGTSEVPESASLLEDVLNHVKAGVTTVYKDLTEEKRQEKELKAKIQKAVLSTRKLLKKPEIESLTDLSRKAERLKNKLNEEGIDELIVEEAVNSVIEEMKAIQRGELLKSKRAEKAATEKPEVSVKKKALSAPEKTILVGTLAMHTGTSLIGSAADATVSVVKGGGRLIVEEVVGLGNSAVDLGKQVGKTLVYPFGRIGFGAKNRASRALDWAINFPTPPATVKKSHAPVHKDEAKEENATETSTPSSSTSTSEKKNIFSRGLSAIANGVSSAASSAWDLTKRAWYRTQQGALILVATPIALVGGALEGAALAIPHDIIGVHWEGEASVSETGAASRKTTDKGFHVDGGAAGIVLSAGKMLKDIVWDAPIRAFEEQLTTIKETPVEADEVKPAKPAKPAEPATGGGDAKHPEEHPEEHHDDHVKKSISPIYTDRRKSADEGGGGFLKALRVLSDAWTSDAEPSKGGFEGTVKAMDDAFGAKDTVTGNLARLARNVLTSGEVKIMDIDYNNLAQQIRHLKPKQRASFFKSIDFIKLNKFKHLIDGARFDEDLEDAELKAEIKKEISEFFGTTGSVNWNDLDLIFTEMVEKLYGDPPVRPTGGSPLRFLNFLGNISIALDETVPVADRRLTKLYGKEKSPTTIDYSQIGAQVNGLEAKKRRAFLDAFDVGSFNRAFWMIIDETRLADELEDDDAEHTKRELIKKKIEAALHIEGRISSAEVPAQIALLMAKFTGLAHGKLVDVQDAFDNIAGALTPANITKIYGNPPEAVAVDDTKLGSQISNLKNNKEKIAFIQGFNLSDFRREFSPILDETRLKDDLDNDDSTFTNKKLAKAKACAALNIKSKLNHAEVVKIVTALKAIFSTVPASYTKVAEITDSLDEIEAALTDDNLDKIFSKDETEVGVQYNKVGEQIIALKAAEIPRFIKDFNKRQFTNRFASLINATSLKKAMAVDPASVKTQLEELTGFKGPINDSAELANLIKDLTDKLGVTTARAGKDLDVKDALEAVKSVVDQATLDKLYPAPKDSIEVKYAKLGEQILKLEDKDMDKYVSSFNERDFKAIYSPLLTTDGFKRAMAKPDEVKTLIADLLGYPGAISGDAEFTTLIDDLDKKIKKSTSPTVKEISARLGEIKTEVNAFRSDFTGETAFQVLYPAAKETPTTIDYKGFGTQAKSLRLDKDKNKFLEAFDPIKFDDAFNYLLSDAGLKLLDTNPTLRPKMQEQFEQLLGRRPLVVDEFIQLMDSIESSIDLVDPTKMSAGASSNHLAINVKLIEIRSRFENSGASKGNFERVFKSTPDLKKVTIEYDRLGSVIPTQKEDILNFLYSLEMKKVMGKYIDLHDFARVTTTLTSPTDPSNSDIADSLMAFFGIPGKPKDLNEAKVRAFKKSMLDNLDETKLGLSAGMPLHSELTGLKDFINKVLP